MSQSVKLSDGSYIDASGVWDNNAGMSQEALNLTKQDLLSVGTSAGARVLSCVNGENIDTSNYVLVPKGKNIVHIQAIYSGSRANAIARIQDVNQVTYQDCLYFCSQYVESVTQNFWSTEGVQIIFLSEDTKMTLQCYAQRTVDITWWMQYINISPN